MTLAGREHAARYREWTWRLIDAGPDLEREDLDRAIAADVTGKRVAFVLHGPGQTVFGNVRQRLDKLLAKTRPCTTTEEDFTNAAGKTIFVIVLADYASCKPAG